MGIKNIIVKGFSLLKPIPLKDKIINYESLEVAVKEIFAEIKKKEPKITRTNTPENDSNKVFSGLGALNLKNWLIDNYTALFNTRLAHGGYGGTGQTLFNLIESAKNSLTSLINSNKNKIENLEHKCMYRVGDILTTENKEHPALTWQGTTWKKIEAAFLRGTEAGQESGVIGGSNTVTLKIGNLPPHNHPISVILGNAGIHRHKVDNHIHAQVSHTHTITAGRQYEGSGNVDAIDSWSWGSRSGVRPSIRSSTAGGENTGGASPYTDNQGNHNHSVTSSSSNVGNGESINILPKYYTVHYWKRVS